MAIMPKIGSVRLTALFSVGVLMASLTGCVSQDQYQRLQTAFDQARQQLAESEADIARLRGQIDQLQAELNEKNALLAAQGGGNDALLKERDALQARLADLQDRYNKLLAMAGNVPQLPQDVTDALQALAAQYPDLLEFDKDHGLVRFKSDLLFALGKADVTPEAKDALAKFSQILNMPEIAQNEIRIVGNTDDIPIRRSAAMVMNPTNWYLSTNRAISVMYVLHDDGLSYTRMQVAGWGEWRPIAPNAPGKKGNPLNRRVDILILPSKVPADIANQPGAMAPTAVPPALSGGAAATADAAH